MTDGEFISQMMRLEKMGYCWRCETQGHELKYDPMGDRQRDNRLTGLCHSCATVRRVIAGEYRHKGTRLKPNRTNEPII